MEQINMSTTNIPVASSNVQGANDFSSRKGIVTQTSASITSAELDTIEAELEARPTKPDRISNITSILTAILVVIKVLNEENWYTSVANIAFLLIGSGLTFIQCFKLIDSFREKNSAHKKNVDRYLKKLREIVGE